MLIDIHVSNGINIQTYPDNIFFIDICLFIFLVTDIC